MSDNTPEKPTLKQQIDGDEQLQKLGRKLSILSLLFMGVMLTGATIEEANTFVFKVKVTTQEAIPAMFLLSVLYLLFRYYTYARPYQKQIDQAWNQRLNATLFHIYEDPEDGEWYGRAIDLQPKGIQLDSPNPNDRQYVQIQYQYTGFFLRSAKYTDYVEEHGVEVEPAPVPLWEKVSIKEYLWFLTTEAKYQLGSFVEDKERLDLWGPYLITGLAILSFFFRSDFQQLVKTLVGLALT